MASNDRGACLRFFFVFVTHNSTHATDTAEQIKPDAVRTRRLRGRGERRRKEESVIYRFVRGPRRARRSGPSHKTRVLGGKVCVMTGDHEGRELPEYRNFSLSLSVCRGVSCVTSNGTRRRLRRAKFFRNSRVDLVARGPTRKGNLVVAQMRVL